eukprot:scaffold48469_cov36-Cyclotella_meneghiniana.AAC.2
MLYESLYHSKTLTLSQRIHATGGMTATKQFDGAANEKSHLKGRGSFKNTIYIKDGSHIHTKPLDNLSSIGDTKKSVRTNEDSKNNLQGQDSGGRFTKATNEIQAQDVELDTFEYFVTDGGTDDLFPPPSPPPPPTPKPTSKPTSPSPSPSASPIENCYPTASKIKLVSTTGEFLHIFEFVATDPSNADLTTNKPATQSSTFYNNTVKYGPANAVDGDAVSFIHTDKGNADPNPVWTVDLVVNSQVSHIEIKNRYCGDTNDAQNCLGRLSYATIELLDNQDNVVESKSFGDTTGVLDLNLDFNKCISTVAPTASPTKSPTPTPTRSPTTQAPTSTAAGGFSYVGTGSCWDSSSKLYSGPYAFLSGIVTVNTCLNWCTQVLHDNLVGVETYLDLGACYCCSSGSFPSNDIVYSDYNPSAENHNSFQGIGAVVSSTRSSTGTGLNYTFTSPLAGFSRVGTGYCLNREEDYYSQLSVDWPGDVTDYDCLNWCSQVPHEDLVGVEIDYDSDTCWCDFSGGIPSDIEYTDYDPSADDEYIDYGVDVVLSSDGTHGVSCYRNDNYSAYDGFSPVGIGYCLSGEEDYYSHIFVDWPGNVTDYDCLNWCSHVLHDDLVGVEIFYDSATCYCDFSGGIPSDIEYTDYDPCADGEYIDYGVGAVLSSDGWIGASCYKNDNYMRPAPVTPAPVTPAPVSSAPVTSAPVTPEPSLFPTYYPTTSVTTDAPVTPEPSLFPTYYPTNSVITDAPTAAPSANPSSSPSKSPSLSPSTPPSASPSTSPSMHPSASPSTSPSSGPTVSPSSNPTSSPSKSPSLSPSSPPSASPSTSPSMHPSASPSTSPSSSPTVSPSVAPVTSSPTAAPTASPSAFP